MAEIADRGHARAARRARARPRPVRGPPHDGRRRRPLRSEHPPRLSPSSRAQEPGTTVTWLIRNAQAVRVSSSADDELADRARLGSRVDRAVADGRITVLDGFEIIRGRAAGDAVELVGHRHGEVVAHATDVVVNATGFRPEPRHPPRDPPRARRDRRGPQAPRAADRPERPLLRHGRAARVPRAHPPRAGLLHRRHEVVRPRADVPARHRLRAGAVGDRLAGRRHRVGVERRAGPPGDRRLLDRRRRRRRMLLVMRHPRDDSRRLAGRRGDLRAGHRGRRGDLRDRTPRRGRRSTPASSRRRDWSPSTRTAPSSAGSRHPRSRRARRTAAWSSTPSTSTATRADTGSAGCCWTPSSRAADAGRLLDDPVEHLPREHREPPRLHEVSRIPRRRPPRADRTLSAGPARRAVARHDPDRTAQHCERSD